MSNWSKERIDNFIKKMRTENKELHKILKALKKHDEAHQELKELQKKYPNDLKDIIIAWKRMKGIN